MFILKKKKGETDDKLIARFRKKTIMEGVMQEYRDLTAYKKPSQKKKEAKIETEQGEAKFKSDKDEAKLNIRKKQLSKLINYGEQQ